MYKLLLSWRYLRTRWIALASIISVTLGVATMWDWFEDKLVRA